MLEMISSRMPQDFFNNFNNGMERRTLSKLVNTCKTDVRENEKDFILESELPGFSKEDISIEICGNILSIKAEHKSNTQEENNENYIYRERLSKSYQRSFRLDGIDSEMINASYKDGILTLIMPKKKDNSLSRKVEIR